MRSILRRLVWLGFGALVALLLLEGVFRVLPVGMGLYRTDQANRWPLQAYQSHRPFTYSNGWQLQNVHRGETNNYGHIAPFDYRKQTHPVVVLGDSFIESQMNVYGNTLQGQLAERLGKPELVYGLGVSGLSIADYLALARMAKEEFAPAAAVIVLVNGDIAESLAPRLGYRNLSPRAGTFEIPYRPLPGNTAMQAVRSHIGEVSLYRYLVGSLGFSLEGILNFDRESESSPQDYSEAGNQQQRQAIDFFLAELPGALGLPPKCISLLLDSDRYAIYRAQSASRPKESPAVRQYLLDRAAALGFAVSDLDPVFRAHYAKDGVKFDYWPADRHWNRVGHGVAAGEAARLLFPNGRADCLPGTR